MHVTYDLICTTAEGEDEAAKERYQVVIYFH